MAGFTRQSSFSDEDIIEASDHNNEYDALASSYSNTTGHSHDGTANEGPVIGVIGDAGVATPLNKVEIDTGNNNVGFWVDVSSVSVEQFTVSDGVIAPVTNNDINLGTASLGFKDLHLKGNGLIAGTLGVTGVLTATAFVGNLTGNASGTAATVTGAAQTAITSLGTLTALQVDNVNVNGNTITASTGALNLTPASGSAIVLDGTINVDAGVVTGATSITSTSLVGALTGDASGSAATVTGASQSAITTLSNLVTTGALNSGSITSGFGAIDIGTSTLAAGATDITGTLDVSGATTLTGGAYIGGTAAANLLDDYEAGTFSGALYEGSNFLTTATGYYVKTGDSVTITWKSNFTVTNTNNGLLYLQGMPFTPLVDCIGNVQVRMLGTGATGLCIFAADASTTLQFRQLDNLGYQANVYQDDILATNGASSDYVWVTVTYLTE